jgi:hypothetical protein
MTYDYHVVLGAIAALLAIAGYWLYYSSIFRRITKPHLFTWLTYFLIDIIVFAAQVVKGGGPGTWVTLTGVIGTFGVSLLALRFGEKHITKGDWASFIGALSAIVLWRVTSDPLIAVIIATIINFLAMYPTIRKSYANPFEESISIWVVDAIRWTLGIVALESFNATTALFPIGLVTANCILIGTILIRRRVTKLTLFA